MTDKDVLEARGVKRAGFDKLKQAGFVPGTSGNEGNRTRLQTSPLRGIRVGERKNTTTHLPCIPSLCKAEGEG